MVGPKNTNIVLKVVADALFNDSNNNDPNVVKSFCQLSDDRNNPNWQPKDGFTSVVDIHRVVIWTAISAESGLNYQQEIDLINPVKKYRVRIEQIEKVNDSNDNFFDKVILPGNSGIAVGITNQNPTAGNLYTYSIWFSITHNGQKILFKLDPQLRGNNIE